ncbi:MAG: NAD(P)H-dependent flavin oxidoreductase [Thermodesulfobacteriota bacterium]
MNLTTWPDKAIKFCELIGIDHPIIQAPMAGGPTTPELVAAVSNTGGLGSFPGGYLSPGEIDSEISKIRSLTDKPFAVNLFAPEKIRRRTTSAKVMKKLGEIAEEVGAQLSGVEEFPEYTFEDGLGAVLDNNVPVLSFTFGIPRRKSIKELLRKKIAVIGTATCVEEGLALEEAGCTAIVAQGSEAGAHRGTFASTGGLPMIGGISLVPRMADKVGVPVICSGGIMDGRGIIAALALGASGVQMGTAFLSCTEAAVPASWLEAILNSSDTSTVLTRVYTGKYARGIRNRFFDEMMKLEDKVPAYPIQNYLTRPIRSAARAKGDPDFMSLWAGQGSPMSRRCTAGELMKMLVAESREVLERIRAKS